jgi:hypothetical protein
LDLASYYKDLDDQEFRALEESWCSNDFLSRYEDLQDKKDLDCNPKTVVQYRCSVEEREEKDDERRRN